MNCKQAIIEGGRITGWIDYKPEDRLTTEQWIKTKESKRIKKAVLEKAILISRSTGERFNLEITKRRPFRWYIKWHLPVGGRLISRSA